MVRVAISVEGTTEERFVESTLQEYFLNKNIQLQPISINGNVSVARVQNELKRIARSFDKITTLYDFYGFKDKELKDTKESLEHKIRTGLDTFVLSRLDVYIQMYEFEGLLFSSPETIAEHIKHNGGKNLTEKWAKEILYEFGGKPETINDSPHTAPSKRLEKYTNYSKTIHGPNIARAIGIHELRQKCPYFDQWLAKIEGWGK